MYFVLLPNFWLQGSFTAAELSSCKIVKHIKGWSGLNNLDSRMIFLVASLATTILASVDDEATIGCLWFNHEAASPAEYTL